MAKYVPLHEVMFEDVLGDSRAEYLALCERLKPEERIILDNIIRPILQQLGQAVVFKAVVTDRPYNVRRIQNMHHDSKQRSINFTIVVENPAETLTIRGMKNLVEWTALTESYIRSSFNQGAGSFTRRFLHPRTGQYVTATVSAPEF